MNGIHISLLLVLIYLVAYTWNYDRKQKIKKS